MYSICLQHITTYTLMGATVFIPTQEAVPTRMHAKTLKRIGYAGRHAATGERVSVDAPSRQRIGNG